MHNRQCMGVLALAALSLAATDVEAEPSGFYIAGAIGQAGQDVRKSDGFAIAVLSPFGGSIMMLKPDAIEVDDDDLAATVTLGYRVNAYFAAEVAYMDFGTADVSEHYSLQTSPSPFFPTEITRDFSVRVRGPALSVLGTVPIHANWDVFLRAGVLFADEKIEPDGPSIPESTTYGSEVLLAGIGVDWSFAQRWTARVEYQRTGTIDENITSGKNELDQVALAVLFRL